MNVGSDGSVNRKLDVRYNGVADVIRAHVPGDTS